MTRTASQNARRSRTKGATFERQVAGELHDRLGITFRRNLEQYQKRDLGDLVTDDPFPFLIECKNHDRLCIPEWWRQTQRAALATGQKPCLIYRQTGKPIRVVITCRAIVEAITRGQWSGIAYLVSMDLDGFSYVAREAMATALTEAPQ